MAIAAFLYGVLCYGVFLASFLYAVGFVGDLWVPKSIDSGAGGTTGEALLVDCALLGLFAVQHSGMARPAFKRWWTRVVPRPVERSTYVLVSSAVLGLLFWQWRPMTDVVWSVQDPAGRFALRALYFLGWAQVLVCSFLIDHFDLFGLRQVYLFLRGKPYEPVPFKKPGPYRLVRHPLLLGFLVAFWATPHMTQGHLLFSLATTGYVLVGALLEERDLARFLGEPYLRYRDEVPMLVPVPRRRRE